MSVSSLHALAITVREAYKAGQVSIAKLNSDPVMPMVLTAIYFAMQTTLDSLVVKGKVQVLKVVFNCSLRYRRRT